MKMYAGIDIGGGSIKGSVISKDGDLFYETTLQTDKYWQNTEYVDAIIEIINELIKKNKPEAIGIGSPGPLDILNGYIIHSTNLPNLKNLALVNQIRAKFGIPVYLNNDANCAALGEYYFGSEKKEHSLVVLTLGTGLGGGWVHNGKLFNGYNGNAMEAGHVTIVKDGALCGCGKKGCAESYFSASGLLNRYEEKTGLRLKAVSEIFDRAIAGETDAIQVIDFGVEVLAELMKSIIHLINPDRIVLVGGLTKSYEYYSPKLIDCVLKNIFPVFADYIKIEKGNSVAGSFGAAALAFDNK